MLKIKRWKFIFGLYLDLWDNGNGTKDLGVLLIEPNVLVLAESEAFLLCQMADVAFLVATLTVNLSQVTLAPYRL